jgi:nicotinate-nucleotide adenylyltransferase
MTAAAARRIGIFGGSFDPVHQAHLALARVALSSLQLTELRLVPVGHAWQKDRLLADASHRIAMLRAAVATEPVDARLVLDDCEVRRGGPSYTVETLRDVYVEAPGAEVFLIIGQDQYAGLHTWYGWSEIVQLATLAVAARADQAVVPSAELAGVPHRMVQLPLPAMVVSSTAVREHLARGETAASLVPALLPVTVAGYIDSHHLYAQGTPR